jgi:hypothetical protein
MRRSALVPLLFLVLAGMVQPAGAATARSRAPEFGHCHVRPDARVLASSTKAVVIRWRSKKHPRQNPVAGCVRSIGRWIPLTTDQPPSVTEIVRVAGTKVAIVQYDPAVEGYPYSSRQLTAVGLRTDTVLNEYYFDDTVEENDEDADFTYPFGRITDLVLGADGRFAFLLHSHDSYLLVMVGPNIIDELDRSPLIAEHSLRRVGAKVCWTRDRARRCAPFQKAP